MTFFFLLLYLIIVLIRPHEIFFVDTLSQAPVVFYTLIVTILFFVFSKNKSLYAPQVLLIILLAGAVVLSHIMNGWFGGGIFWGRVFGSVAVIPFILFSSVINTPTRYKLVMLVCITSALIMVNQGMDQKAAEDGVGWAGVGLSERTRITYLGTLNDPNDLALFFVITLPMAIYFLGHVSKLFKIIPLLAIDFILYGIYLTNSRGALLSLICICGVWGLRKFGYLKMLFVGASVMPLVFFIMSKFRKIEAGEDSAAGRIEAWYAGIEMLKQNPLFGVGMGAFTEYHELTAHNTFIQVLAELGMVGFTLWCSFIILTFVMLYKVMTYTVSFIQGSSKAKELSNTSLELTEGENIKKINVEVALANTAFYSMLGFVSTSFFLSRGYTFLLYIYSGLAVASYYRARAVMPRLQAVVLAGNKIWLIKLTLYMVIFLYFVIKFLV